MEGDEMISKANREWVQEWIDQCGWAEVTEGGYVELPEEDNELYRLIQDLQMARSTLERYLRT
jgi:hypothetical protein